MKAVIMILLLVGNLFFAFIACKLLGDGWNLSERRESRIILECFCTWLFLCFSFFEMSCLGKRNSDEKDIAFESIF